MLNKKTLPLWISMPKAMNWFNYFYCIPRVTFSTFKVWGGLKEIKSKKPIVFTCSIAEDYARVWLYFAQKNLSTKNWKFVVVDSAGDMDPRKFKNCEVVKFVNFYHGRKVDTLIRKTLLSDQVFLCDDDRFIVGNINYALKYLKDSSVPAVSLAPRIWWHFKIKGKKYFPMGSYGLLFKRKFFIEKNLSFKPRTDLESKYKKVHEGHKKQMTYDTADHANEQLLLEGFKIKTLPKNKELFGFDGLSAPRLLLMKYGKDYVKRSLQEAKHFKRGSINGAAMMAMYGIVKFEKFYKKIFLEDPKFMSGFSEKELIELVNDHSNLSAKQKAYTKSYFKRLESTFSSLAEFI